MFMKVHEPSIKRYAENGNLFSAYFTENRKETTSWKASLFFHLSFVLCYRKVHSMGKCINREEEMLDPAINVSLTNCCNIKKASQSA